MKTFRCTCHSVLGFDDSFCNRCGCQVGFDFRTSQMIPLLEGETPHRCANGVRYGICNGLTHDSQGSLCPACTLNRTVPDTSDSFNHRLWARMEAAKRRVVYTL